MANTFTQLYVHIVFAVKGRQNQIAEAHREKLERFICGIISKRQSKPIAIYCNPDHVHVLIGLHPSVSISDMARDIKANSSRWINSEEWANGKFSWQTGFGAFTYSRSQIDSVINYILNQPSHHKRLSFRDEFTEILNKFNIEYNDKYIFDFVD